MGELTHEDQIVPLQMYIAKADKSKPPSPKDVKAFIDSLKNKANKNKANKNKANNVVL